MTPATRAPGPRASWYAVGGMLAVLLVAGTLLAVALSGVEININDLGDTDDEQSGWHAAALVCGLVAFIAAPAVAAWLSGWRWPVRIGLLAFLAFLVVFTIGAGLFDGLFNDVGPALVAGLAAEGSIAVRPPSQRAISARLRTTVGVVLVATAFTAADIDAVVAGLILLTPLSVAMADTLAARIERRAPT